MKKVYLSSIIVVFLFSCIKKNKVLNITSFDDYHTIEIISDTLMIKGYKNDTLIYKFKRYDDYFNLETTRFYKNYVRKSFYNSKSKCIFLQKDEFAKEFDEFFCVGNDTVGFYIDCAKVDEKYVLNIYPRNYNYVYMVYGNDSTFIHTKFNESNPILFDFNSRKSISLDVLYENDSLTFVQYETFIDIKRCENEKFFTFDFEKNLLNELQKKIE